MDMAFSRQIFESCHASSFEYIDAKSNHASISNFCRDLTCQGQMDHEQGRNMVLLLKFNKDEGIVPPYKWSISKRPSLLE
jgi:hypothetical protein